MLHEYRYLSINATLCGIMLNWVLATKWCCWQFFTWSDSAIISSQSLWLVLTWPNYTDLLCQTVCQITVTKCRELSVYYYCGCFSHSASAQTSAHTSMYVSLSAARFPHLKDNHPGLQPTVSDPPISQMNIWVLIGGADRGLSIGSSPPVDTSRHKIALVLPHICPQ